MLKLGLIGLSRCPRILFLGVIALRFGISGDTDTFFFIYSVVTFLIATIAYASEIMAPHRRTLISGVVGATIVLLVSALITHSTLALMFVPYISVAGFASVLIGISNRGGHHIVLLHTGLPYLGATILLFLLEPTFPTLIILLSITEIVRGLIAILTTRRLPRISVPWTYSIGMLIAIAIGGFSSIIDRIYAGAFLGEGAITQVSYAFGAVLAIANMGTYSVSVLKINDLRLNLTIPVLVTSIISILILLVAFISSSFFPLFREALILTALISMLIPLGVLIHISIAYCVVYQDYKGVLIGASIFTVSNTVLDYLLIGWGIYGIGLASILSTSLYLTFLELWVTTHYKTSVSKTHSISVEDLVNSESISMETE